MAVTYTEGEESDTDFSFVKPSVAANDWMVIFVFYWSENNGVFEAPAGWDTVYNTTWFDYIRMGCFIRKVDGTEGAGPYVVNSSSSASYGRFGSIGKLSGVDGTTAIRDSGTANGTGTSAPTGTVVDATTDDFAFYQVAHHSGASGNPAAQFGGTVIQTIDLDGGSSEMWTENVVSGGTGKQYTVSWSGSNGWVCGFAVFQAAAGAAVLPLRFVPQYQAAHRAATI